MGPVSPLRLRLAASLLAAATVGGVACAPARADGDPASDTLIFSNLFVPYSQPISKSLTKQLETALLEAKRKRRPIKMALIASPQDLGAVGGVWGMPKQYAIFLGQELSVGSVNKALLVVIMPSGIGLYAGQKPVTAEQAKISGINPGKDATSLAHAGLDVVDRLAGVQVASSDNSASRDRIIIVLAAAVGLLIVLALSFLTSRLRGRRPPSSAET